MREGGGFSVICCLYLFIFSKISIFLVVGLSNI